MMRKDTAIKRMIETIRKQDNFRQDNNPLPEEWSDMYCKLRNVVLDFLAAVATDENLK